MILIDVSSNEFDVHFSILYLLGDRKRSLRC